MPVHHLNFVLNLKKKRVSKPIEIFLYSISLPSEDIKCKSSTLLKLLMSHDTEMEQNTISL